MTCQQDPDVGKGGGGGPNVTTIPQVPVRTVDINSPPPGILGFIWGYMNKTEKRLCWEGITACNALQTTMFLASAVDGVNGFTFFHDSAPDCSPRNAIKHAYWNALMVNQFKSEAGAKLYADAHEAGDDGLGDKCPLQPGRINPASKMDYHNNHVGRQVALALLKVPYNFSADHLYFAVYQAYKDGALVVECEQNNDCFPEEKD